MRMATAKKSTALRPELYLAPSKERNRQYYSIELLHNWDPDFEVHFSVLDQRWLTRAELLELLTPYDHISANLTERLSKRNGILVFDYEHLPKAFPIEKQQSHKNCQVRIVDALHTANLTTRAAFMMYREREKRLDTKGDVERLKRLSEDFLKKLKSLEKSYDRLVAGTTGSLRVKREYDPPKSGSIWTHCPFTSGWKAEIQGKPSINNHLSQFEPFVETGGALLDYVYKTQFHEWDLPEKTYLDSNEQPPLPKSLHLPKVLKSIFDNFMPDFEKLIEAMPSGKGRKSDLAFKLLIEDLAYVFHHHSGWWHSRYGKNSYVQQRKKFIKAALGSNSVTKDLESFRKLIPPIPPYVLSQIGTKMPPRIRRNNIF